MFGEMAKLSLKNEFTELKSGFQRLESRFGGLESRFDGLEARLVDFEHRTDQKLLQYKEEMKSFSAVQFEELKHMIQIVIEGFSGHTQRIDDHESRIVAIEDKI